MSEYEYTLREFQKLKKQYEYGRHYAHSNYRFMNRLNIMLAKSIKDLRSETHKQQIKNGIKMNRDTVHDFTGAILTHDGCSHIIANGPNFIPVNNIGNVHHLARETKSNVKEALYSFSTRISGCPVYNHSKNIALALNLNHPKFNGNNLQYMLDILDRLTLKDDYRNFDSTGISNMQPQDLEYINRISNDPNIIINTADKILGFSINHINWYVQEYKRQLSDNEIYEQLPFNHIPDIIEEGRKELLLIYNKYANDIKLKNYDLTILKSRQPKDIKLPTLNIMPKVHKLKEKASIENENKVKGRPIVNGFATLNTEPSKLLGTMFRIHLTNLINLFKARKIHCPIVDGSRKVIDRLNAKSLENYNLDDVYFISFDFSSLYTSIKKWTVFDTLHYLGATLKVEQIEVNLMKALFMYIKRYACFTVGNTKLYLQKEGFAMGSYDSGDGANLVLLKSEYFMLQDTTISSRIIEFFRFIDDGSLTVELKPQFINSFLKKLVAFYPKELEIEFKVTKFTTVFLDISYGISFEAYSDSKFHYRIFQKKFNAYSYLNFESNHPFGVFKGIIKTECHRYRYTSCNKNEYEHMCKLFQIRLKKCGYSERFIKKHTIEYEQQKKVKRKTKDSNVRCKINFNKAYNPTDLYKRIFKNGRKSENIIKTCYVTGNKLKALLLTTKRLHDKLQKHM